MGFLSLSITDNGTACAFLFPAECLDEGAVKQSKSSCELTVFSLIAEPEAHILNLGKTGAQRRFSPAGKVSPCRYRSFFFFFFFFFALQAFLEEGIIKIHGLF
jgi:hypothetical protein